MKKEDVLLAHQNYIVWLDSLACFSEEKGKIPYRNGKWSPSEIIMHLAEWDRFTLEYRLPRMKEGEVHERYPDFQRFNEKAAALANEQTFKETLTYAKEQRKKFREQLKQIDESEWDKIFFIEQHAMSVRQYFTNFIDHDRHHMQQITSFL